MSPTGTTNTPKIKLVRLVSSLLVMNQPLFDAEPPFVGDFVTSPEISPLFCELIGIWCVATWEAMGYPAQINLVELGNFTHNPSSLYQIILNSSCACQGPGKGTLMKEILRTARSFPLFERAVSVHMVEVSEVMRKVQQSALLANKSLPDNVDLIVSVVMNWPPHSWTGPTRCISGESHSWYC
jgi:hypothetical protein